MAFDSEAKTIPRYVKRRENEQFREKTNGFVAVVAEMNETLRGVAEGVLIGLGYRRHHRSEWRVKLNPASPIQQWLKGTKMNVQPNKTEPVQTRVLPVNETGDIELLARARAGDAAAFNGFRYCSRTANGWSVLGECWPGGPNGKQLVARVAGKDPVKKSGFAKYADAIYAELLGDKPSILEKLLARRVINGWIAVNALELELADCNSDRLVRRSHLDKAITQRKARDTPEAINELMRVRRLQAPRFLAQATTVSENAA